MAIVDTSNVKLSNGKLYENNIHFLAKNMTDGIVSMFTLGIATLENLSGISKRFLPTTTSDNWVNGSDGSLLTNLPSNVEAPSSTITLTYKVDYNGRVEKTAYGLSSNIYEIATMGGSFYVGADKYVVVSTLGTFKNGKKATKCSINQVWGRVWRREYNNLFTGGFDEVTGEPIFETNTFISKVKQEAPNTFVLESTVTLGDGTVSSLLMPALYTTNSPISIDDGGDSYSLECMVVTDVVEGDNAITLNARKSYEVTYVNKPYLEVDYIVYGTALPTDFGVSGDVIAFVNSTTGAVLIETSDGSAWTVNATGTFEQDAKITANKITTSTIASATAERNIVVLASANASNGGVATDFDTKVGTSQFYCKMFTQDRETEGFVRLTVEGTAC